MEQFVKVGRSKSSIVSVNLNRETSEDVYEEEIVFARRYLLSSVELKRKVESSCEEMYIAHLDFAGMFVLYWKERLLKERDIGIPSKERKIVEGVSASVSEEIQFVNFILFIESES